MTVQTPPDSWRLFAEWLPILAPGRRQDREMFERSNKGLNRVSGNLIGLWNQRCAGQPTVAGTTVGIPGRVRLLARGRPSARGLQARRSDGGFLVRGPAAVEVADVEAIRQDPARFRAKVLVRVDGAGAYGKRDG